MQNTATTVIALVIAIILILVVPMFTLTERNDNVTQEKVKQIVEEFVTDVKNTGVVTTSKYQTFESTLNATGNIYNIEVQLQILDENPGKKNEQANYTKIGENVYYTEFTSQVLEKLDKQDGKLELKEGDYITVSVKNENDTAAQNIKRNFLGLFNTEQYEISATSSGMINANASNKEIAETETYMIIYDSNGGIGIPSAQEKEHGKNIILSTVKPEKKDYVFIGWNTNKDATVAEFLPGDTYEEDQDVTLYAIWEIKQSFIISYDANGGTGVVPEDQIKNSGRAMTIAEGNQLSKDQYHFAGWSLSRNGGVDYLPGDTYVRDESITLYAVWDKISIYICSINPSDNQDKYEALPELIANELRTYYKRAKIDYSYGEASLQYLKDSGRNYDLVIINEVEKGDSRLAEIINRLSESINVITIGNEFNADLDIISDSTTLTAKLNNIQKNIETKPIATDLGKDLMGLDIDSTTVISTESIKFIDDVDKLYGAKYNSEGNIYQDTNNTNAKSISTEHLIGAWENWQKDITWLHTQMPLIDEEVILKLVRYVLEGNNADLIEPVWTKVSETADPLKAGGSIAEVVVQGTDNNLQWYQLTNSDIKVFVDGKEVSKGITVTVSNPTVIKNGVQYTITIKGFESSANQVKIEIGEGTLKDSNKNANSNKATQIIAYNTLVSVEYEHEKESGFLGNSRIQRQHIQNITFVSSIEDANATKWDVSAQGDGSIIAWFRTVANGKYKVFVGSKDKIYANQNSSCLFSYIGYSEGCTQEEVITNIELLNTNNVKEMQYMFQNCGYTAMTKLDLGDNFITKNVTNMRNMFYHCGYEKMTELNLRSNFDTSNVTNMNSMFCSTGYVCMTELDLGDKFDTSKVTDMSHMFRACGATSMTKLDLGVNFNTSAVTNMSHMFRSTGYESMVSLNLGNQFYTSEVTDMSYMFYSCGYKKMASLNLGNNFYTKKVSNMSYMFRTCGCESMTELDLGPAFVKIPSETVRYIDDNDTIEDVSDDKEIQSSANDGFLTNTGKSRCVIYVPESIYKDINNLKLNAHTTTAEISYTRGTINLKYIPKWTVTNTTVDASLGKIDITLQGKDELSIFDLAGSILTEEKINVYIDGVLVKNIGKTLSNVKALTNNGVQYGVEYVLTLNNLEEASVQTGKSYLEWSGNITLVIEQKVLKDIYGNSNYVETLKNEETNKNSNGILFVDTIKPAVTKISSTADELGKTQTIIFTVIDKYLEKLDLNESKIQVYVDNELASSVKKSLTNEDIKATVNGENVVIGKQYTLELSIFQNPTEFNKDEMFFGWSGPVSIVIPEAVAIDYSGNKNAETTIEGEFVDFVKPVWIKVNETADPLHEDGSIAELTVRGIDKYFSGSTLTNKIKVYVDGTEIQSGITITPSTAKKLTEQRDVNGVMSTVQYGVEYTITIKDYKKDANQVKVELLSGSIWDLEGNTNDITEFIVYNTLKNTSSETAEGSGFLGNGRIHRQNIEKVIFQESLDDAPIIDGINCWDVSAQNDASMLAWYKETSVPYTVYIASNDKIYANQDSSYLFSYIGYATGCTETKVIENIKLLNTNNVTNMSAMFQACGYNAMTSLELGDNFDTGHVEKMQAMFYECGYNAMETLKFGNKFDTSCVTDMSSMFAKSGYKKIKSLDLGEKFFTTKVIDMQWMFKECGVKSLKTLDLGNNFDTSNVTKMRYMFAGCGHEKMTNLYLGEKFYTTKVTDMTCMFQDCGTDSMTSLDLGQAFTKIPSGNVTGGSDESGETTTGVAYDNFVNQTGKSDCVIYVGETIYQDINNFRLEPQSTTTINYERGTINCKYRTEWEKVSTSINANDKTLTIVLKSTEKYSGSSYDSSQITKENIHVYIEGIESEATKINKELSGPTSTTNGQQYTLVLSGFEEAKRQDGNSFTEWSGNVILKIDRRVSFDDYGHGNLETEISGNTNGSMFVDFIKPEFTYIHSDEDISIANKKVTITFDVIDKYFKESTLTNANQLTIKLNGTVIDSTVSKTFKSITDIKEVVDGAEKVIGKRYVLELSDIEKSGSGIVTIVIPKEIAEDTSGNKNNETTITIGIDIPEPKPGQEPGAIVDFILPIVKYTYLESDIDTIYNTVTVAFTITDDYFKESTLTSDKIVAKIGDTTIIPDSFKTLTSQDMFGVVNGENKIIGQSYILTLSGINESGEIKVYIPKEIAEDTSGNKNNATTILVANGKVIDVIEPVWEKGQEEADPLRPENEGGSIAKVLLKGTDDYKISQSKLSTLKNSDITVYVDGIVVTDGIDVTVDEPTLTNGEIQHLVTVTGYDSNAHQLKIEIAKDTLSDDSGNKNLATQIIMFNTLKTTENDGDWNYASSIYDSRHVFLGNANVMRQYVEKVEFLSSKSEAPTLDGITCWDVSAQGDGSILAWYETTENGKLSVYIGSDDKIYANQDSSYLFAYIGFSAGCTETETIKNIDLLNVHNVKYMTGMFQYFGFRAMTELSLGDNFDTSNVTNMRRMFLQCGSESMTKFSLGSKFDTSNVTDMSGMFYGCGSLALINLDLGDKFNTSKVTDMNNMFAYCGYTAMTSLDLGDLFYTKNVTNMARMFNNCGHTALTTLDLGPVFIQIPNGTVTTWDDNGTLDTWNDDIEITTSANQDFVTGTGRERIGEERCIIYASEAIYQDIHHFKLNDTSETTIEYSRGDINPKHTMPKWIKVSENADPLNKNGSVAEIVVKAQDDKFASATLDKSHIKVFVNRVDKTNEVEFTVNEMKTITNGVEYTITVQGFETNADQVKIQIAGDTVQHNNGNINSAKEFILYNTLKLTKSETTATSGFLGNTSIQRQNIENIEFVSNIETAPTIDGTTCWDVSAQGDKSILAWYVTNANGKLKVYIGSDDKIYANQDTSYLFAYIGYASGCTATETITNIGLLNTHNVKNMGSMFYNTGYTAMTQLNLGNNFITDNVIDMNNMFQECGYTAMINLNLGDSFNTINVVNMENMFNSCGNQSMKTLTLGNKFYSSNVTNMSHMFYSCGSQSMISLVLGDNFDTSSVNEMDKMFAYCGNAKMTSLDLGDKFYTTNATDMTNMFNNCGTYAMTSLDLGPAFTKITDTCTDFVTNTGASGCVIYAGESIYENTNNFRLNPASATAINYTIGTINCKYRTEWTKVSTTVDTANKKVTVILETTENYSNSSYASSDLEVGNIHIYLDGTTTELTSITKTLTGPTAITNGEQYVLVLSGFEESLKQSGNIALKIDRRTSLDDYGNGNLVTEIKDTDVDKNTEGTLFADFIKPEITYKYSFGNIDSTNKQVIVVFDAVDKYFANSDLTADILTAIVDGTTITDKTLTSENITETVNGKVVIIGKRYTLVLNGLIEDGIVTVSIPAGKVTDTSGNTNEAKTITVGVNIPDGTGTGVVVDFIKPIITYTYSESDINYDNNTVQLVFEATDDYFSSSSLTASEIIAKVGDTEITGKNLTDTSITGTIDGISKTIGKRYTLVLSELTETGVVTVVIPEGKVTDESGNSNDVKTITLGVNIPDGTGSGVIVDLIDPAWEKVVENADPLATTGSIAEVTVTATDDYNFKNTTLTKENIKVLVNGTEVTEGITVTVTEVGTNQYKVTVTGYPTDAHQVKIEIETETAFDIAGNTNNANQIIVFNTLKSAASETAETSGFLGNTSIQRQNIENIEFVSSTAGANGTKWDVSAQGDGSILAWYVTNANGKLKVYIGSDHEIYANQDASYLFANIGYSSGCTATETITNLSLLNTHNATNMKGMFYNTGYTAMTSLNLESNFNTSSVTDMSYMFQGCGYTAMKSLRLEENFDTTKVTDMTGMFQNTGHTAMTSLYLGDKFTKISNKNTDFVTGCGMPNATNDACTIYVHDEIYRSKHYFKLNENSTITVPYSRGIIYSLDTSDITLSSIDVISPPSGMYKEGQIITFVATYTGNINIVETEPTLLKIQFGSGEVRTATFSSVSGNQITYTYTIQSGDNEKLTVISYTGKVIDSIGRFVYLDVTSDYCSGTTHSCTTEYCPGSTSVDCTTCGADGTVTCTYSNCNGDGYLAKTRSCTTCGGDGAVKCPAVNVGVSSTTTLECSGCGDQYVWRNYYCSDCGVSGWGRDACSCTAASSSNAHSGQTKTCTACSGKGYTWYYPNCPNCGADGQVDCTACVDGKIVQPICEHDYSRPHYHCEHGDDITSETHYYCDHNLNGVAHLGEVTVGGSTIEADTTLPEITYKYSAANIDSTNKQLTVVFDVIDKYFYSSTLTNASQLTIKLNGTAIDTTVSKEFTSITDITNGKRYTLVLSNIQASGAGVITVSIPAGIAKDKVGNTNEGKVITVGVNIPDGTGDGVIVDFENPTVTSITANVTNPTNSSSITYTVTFSEEVTGFATSDVIVNSGKGTVTSVTGSGKTWTVEVSTTDDVEYTETITVKANGNVIDNAGNKIATAKTSTGIVVDRIDPTVTSITADATTPTNAGSITYTVTFSEEVTGFVASDVTVNSGKGSVTSVTGSGTTWTVVVSTADNAEYTETITVKANGAATDKAGNKIATAKTSTGIVVDRIDPIVTLITTDAANPTNASSITYTVTFSKEVTGFAESDVTVNSGKGSVTSVTGSGTTWTVVVSTVDNAEYTETITVKANGSVIDSVGNKIVTAKTSEEIVVDREIPTVTLITADVTSPTNAGSITYTVIFSEEVTGFAEGDITVNSGKGSVTSVTGNGTTWTVVVSTTDDVEYTETITVKANGATIDKAGNKIATAKTSTGIVVDRIDPTVTSITADATTSTNASSITYTVIFSEAVTEFEASDITVNSGKGSVTSVNGSGTTWTVVVSTTDNAEYTETITVKANGNVIDNVGNKITTAKTSEAIVVDRIKPEITYKYSTADINVGSKTVTVVFDMIDKYFDSSTLIDASQLTIKLNGTAIDTTVSKEFTSITDITNGKRFTLVLSNIQASGTGVITVSIPSEIATDKSGNTNEGKIITVGVDIPDGTGDGVMVDFEDPTVTSITADVTSPTNVENITYTVTFSEEVTEFATSDVIVNSGKGSVTSVNGSGTTWTVVVSTTDNVEYTETITIKANGNVIDDVGNKISTAKTSTGIVVDRIDPTVTSITADVTSPTNAGSITYTVTFSEEVTGFEASDVIVNSGKGTVTSVTGEGTTWTVLVSTTDNEEYTETITVKANGSVIDDVGNKISTTKTSEGIEVDFIKPEFTYQYSKTDINSTDEQVTVVFDIVDRYFSESILTSDMLTAIVDGTTITDKTLTSQDIANGKRYTLVLNGLVEDGIVTVAIPEGIATDTLGNTNEGKVITVGVDLPGGTTSGEIVDFIKPVITYSETVIDYDNNMVTVIFEATDDYYASESLVASDITAKVGGITITQKDLTSTELEGTVDATTKTIGKRYTLVLSGLIQSGELTISIPDGIAKDTSGNENNAKTITLEIYLSIELEVGDFINYDAGTWTQDEIEAIQTGEIGSLVTANGSTSLPSTAFQFGGFTAGSSRNGNATPDSTTYNYVKDESTRIAITGWRVFDIGDDGTVTLISAGNPEDYYQPYGTNDGYISEYILTGQINSSWSSSSASSYQKREWSNYINSNQKATSATVLTKSKLDSWYSKYIVANANTQINSTFQKIYTDEAYIKYQNMIENYSRYWLSEAYASDELVYIWPDPDLRGLSDWSDKGTFGGDIAFGVRVLVTLSPEASYSLTGTKTVTGGNTTTYGGDQTYNVWSINE